MKNPATVRIKGSTWEAPIDANRGKAESDIQQTPVSPALHLVSKIKGGGGMLLSLAVRHFRGLQLNARDAGKLASALGRCLKGESLEVGPVGYRKLRYNFRRHANAISIRTGEARMRLPLEIAGALARAIRLTVSPRVAW